MTRRYMTAKQVLQKTQDMIQLARNPRVNVFEAATLVLRALRIAREWNFSLQQIGTTDQEVTSLSTPYFPWKTRQIGYL